VGEAEPRIPAPITHEQALRAPHELRNNTKEATKLDAEL